MISIKKAHARQILDSRGNPTVEVDIYLSDGAMGRAAVPSGASTGKREAIELRDGLKVYHGKSVYKAIENIKKIIFPAIQGINPTEFRKIDEILLNLDGTKNKSNLGANAILGVSLACAKATSNSKRIPFYQYLHNGNSYYMPAPMINIVNGGCHANNNIDFQEFMIYPLGAESFTHALRIGVEIFQYLQQILKKKGLNTSVGDEGGFAPNLKSNEAAIEVIMEAINKSSYKAGKDVFLALDIAASEFYNSKNNLYNLESENKKMNSYELINYYNKLCKTYPIVSIEDGLDESDWDGWSELNKKLGHNIQIVGDDLTVTNKKILDKAIKRNAINAILIKLNQIGTLSETLNTITLAQQNNLGTIISHRSGETEDTIIADFSVATNALQIKTGSVSRTDRTSKYNQLLRIEETIGCEAKYAGSNILSKIKNDHK